MLATYVLKLKEVIDLEHTSLLKIADTKLKSHERRAVPDDEFGFSW